ncbi:hypothetical protein LMH87_010333 [Akanthomyces muscarius]|uniref:Uncharacterized protein n=2 Tax=Akanthomyces TaxID=150366 RepID=A0A168GRQ8_CORDF|nr:hypothetical protein LMH87_010333 [Akanthomyces muscarius]KAJ4153865.1 hypothetical protein LMH87_010333 [Akanthomyces muscarius]OAA76834.1 hypothetical protein LEL_06518 [Akanthomyces lecanii RCEF 1005]
MKLITIAASTLLVGLALATSPPKPDGTDCPHTGKPPVKECPLGQHLEFNAFNPGGPPVCIPDGAVQ